MKAMILAAGLGTRLRPLADTVPKCLMPLAGRPLIDWTMPWLKSAGVSECIINLHYLPDKVKGFLGDGSRYGIKIHFSFEPELLGTAGAVKKVADFFDQPFYVIYSDNFSQWDLTRLKLEFDKRETMAVVAVHWREDVTQSGMIELDGDNRIIKLFEKPKPEEVTSHYVSAGFFYLDPKVLDYVPENKFWDFGFQVFPDMLRAGEKIYGEIMDSPIIGIDTIESYQKANEMAMRLMKEDHRRDAEIAEK